MQELTAILKEVRSLLVNVAAEKLGLSTKLNAIEGKTEKIIERFS